MPAISTPTVTIANAGSLSGAASVGYGSLQGIIMPATWTAAVVTFQGSVDGVTFFDVFDYNGTEVSATVVANHLVPLDAVRSCPWIKVRSGTTGSPVAQGAARDIILIIHKTTVGA